MRMIDITEDEDGCECGVRAGRAALVCEGLAAGELKIERYGRVGRHVIHKQNGRTRARSDSASFSSDQSG